MAETLLTHNVLGSGKGEATNMILCYKLIPMCPPCYGRPHLLQASHPTQAAQSVLGSLSAPSTQVYLLTQGLCACLPDRTQNSGPDSRDSEN